MLDCYNLPPINLVEKLEKLSTLSLFLVSALGNVLDDFDFKESEILILSTPVELLAPITGPGPREVDTLLTTGIVSNPSWIINGLNTMTINRIPKPTPKFIVHPNKINKTIMNLPPKVVYNDCNIGGL